MTEQLNNNNRRCAYICMYASFFFFVLCSNTKFKQDKMTALGFLSMQIESHKRLQGPSVLGRPVAGELGQRPRDGGAGRPPLGPLH